ncbi:MAG: hypothetical protein IJG53_01650 [Eggerthellaceae bacterium]|nr:hypothetical protein [Eggerthellaceae bacterium]
MKKTLIALVACAALAATLAIAGCNPGGSGGSGGNEPTPSPTPTPTPSPSPDPAPVQSVTVSDLFRQTGVYKDPAGYEITFAYVLPKVTGPDTDYIFDINMFVQKKNKQFVDPALTAMANGESPAYVDVEYQAQAVGNMITLLFTWSNQYDGITEYQVWLIKADGTKAENAELFAAKGVTEEQVLAKLRETLESIVEKPSAAHGDMEALVKEAYDKTMSSDNINGHLPFYVNDEGHLAVAATVYTIAGAGWKTFFLDLGF